MAKKKKRDEPLRMVLHISTFKKLKGEKSRKATSRQRIHEKGSNVYTTKISFGDKQIISRKVYFPASVSDQENVDTANSYVSKFFNQFKKTSQNDFTVTAQYFKGKVSRPFRAGISGGKVSKGAHVKAFKLDALKREIGRLNKLRKKKGRKLLRLDKVLEGTLSNIRTDFATEIKALERQTTSPTDKARRSKRTKKRIKRSRATARQAKKKVSRVYKQSSKQKRREMKYDKKVRSLRKEKSSKKMGKRG